MMPVPPFRARKVAPVQLPKPRPSCRTCGLPKSAHEIHRNGMIRPKAWARARLGDTVPPICWTREMGQGDLNFRSAFQRRSLDPAMIQRVYARSVA